MNEHIDPAAMPATPEDLARLGRVISELSRDFVRVARGALPIALREGLQRDVAPAEIERVAEILFGEAAARYRVAAAATLLTCPFRTT